MAGRTGHQEAGEDGSLLEDQARSADLLPEEFRAHEEGGISGHVMIFLIFLIFCIMDFSISIGMYRTHGAKGGFLSPNVMFLTLDAPPQKKAIAMHKTQSGMP